MIALLYMLAVIVVGMATLPQAFVVVARAFVAIVDGDGAEELGPVLKSLEPVLGQVVVPICIGFFIVVALGFLTDTIVGWWKRTTRQRSRGRRSQPFARAGGGVNRPRVGLH
jgi:uncharacterized membrane protein (DUF106 family)